jgi:hypothetical protein
MKRIHTFESFISESRAGKFTGKETDFSTEDFKSYFSKNYSHISHSLSDKEVVKFLEQPTIKRVTLAKAADYFSDYLLANGLADEVSEDTTE